MFSDLKNSDRSSQRLTKKERMKDAANKSATLVTQPFSSFISDK